jgi:hypothetical protein
MQLNNLQTNSIQEYLDSTDEPNLLKFAHKTLEEFTQGNYIRKLLNRPFDNSKLSMYDSELGKPEIELVTVVLEGNS